MDLIRQLIEIVLHLDQYLAGWTHDYGMWMYVILFLIVFAETGLVVTPFLPGDSLLFAVGAITALEGSALNIYYLIPLLMLATFLGDNVNYRIGFFIGPQIFNKEDSIFLKRKNLIHTEKFYQKYGALTVIIARFMPIVRTFAPFVAGVARMPYLKYLGFSMLGSILWINSFLWAGKIFGNNPIVKSNFHIVIFAVIGLSVLPMFIAFIHSKVVSNR